MQALKQPVPIHDTEEPLLSFDFHQDGLIIDLSISGTDPFYTTQEREQLNEGSLRPSDEAVQTRRRLSGYASATFIYQHRTHIFQLAVFGQYARFFFFDPANIIVSYRFNYVKQPHILAEFFWRYNHMSDVQRGLDASVC